MKGRCKAFVLRAEECEYPLLVWVISDYHARSESIEALFFCFKTDAHCPTQQIFLFQSS